jgi:hypothetical protein
MIVKKEEAVIKKASKAIQVTGKIKGAFKKILSKKQRELKIRKAMKSEKCFYIAQKVKGKFLAIEIE